MILNLVMGTKSQMDPSGHTMGALRPMITMNMNVNGEASFPGFS